MRNQYKVLSERYEQVQEDAPDIDYKFLVDRLVEMYRPEDKDKFLKFLNEHLYRLFYFDVHSRKSRITGVHAGLTQTIQRTLDPLRPVGNQQEDTLTNHLYRAVYFGSLFLTFRPVRGEPYTKKHARKQYESYFDAWSKAMSEYKAIQAALTQHTKTHGVDLSNL